MDAILSGIESEQEFDEKGKSDAEWLSEVIGPNKIVLDLGCGIGRIEKFLAFSCRELHAADVSEVMLKKASQRLSKTPNLTFHRVDGQSLSGFRDEMFDAVFSLLVLQHLAKEDAFLYLLEFHRILKKEGLCIVQFPNLDSESYFKDFLSYAKMRPYERPLARMRCYTSEEVEFLLNKAGFKIQDIKRPTGEMIVIAHKHHPAVLLPPD
jgi:ubiquinone/menaquinone biosynthesis C-methylase UbiE